jgi:diguanylate cyclase (GGDEF)-like protein
MSVETSTVRRDAASRGGDRTGVTAVDDLLVFEHYDDGFTLVGASGRRSGWVGIVELDAGDAALVGRAWERGAIERVRDETAQHIAGPYYAPNAVVVPVGQGHVVVFGATHPVNGSDAEFVALAAVEVDRARGVSADKLLADELEVVHALRELMAYRPERVRDTVVHVAEVAASALSCDVAVVRLNVGDQVVVESLDLRSRQALDAPDPGGHLAIVPMRATVAQAAPAHPDLFGVAVASHLILPLPGSTHGALALGHTTDRARGFTSLCQRIGRSIAEAAELLIDQAATREALAGERDQLAGMVHTDALTGVGSRRTWDEQVALWRSNVTHPNAVLISCDLDGLKSVNDRYGHVAGDAMIRGAANLLNACIRDSDTLVRVGGDEFVVLLAPADEAAARQVIRRIRRAGRASRVTEHGLPVQLSIGHASVIAGDLEGARSSADGRMYVNKRRRALRAS